MVSNTLIAIILASMESIDNEQMTNHEADVKSMERIDSVIEQFIKKKEQQRNEIDKQISTLTKGIFKINVFSSHTTNCFFHYSFCTFILKLLKNELYFYRNHVFFPSEPIFMTIGSISVHIIKNTPLFSGANRQKFLTLNKS